jgi:hypothetical protein
MGATSNVTLATSEQPNEVQMSEVLRLVQSLVVTSTRTQAELAQLRTDQQSQHALSESSRLARLGQDDAHAATIKDSLEALHRTILVDISMVQEEAENKIRSNFDEVRDSIGLLTHHQQEGARMCEMQQRINETVSCQLNDMQSKVCEERSGLSLQSNVTPGSTPSFKRKQSLLTEGSNNEDRPGSLDSSNEGDYITRLIRTASRLLANRMRARTMALP